MLKKKNAKKIMNNYKENAQKIKCEYCDIYSTCTVKIQKEKSEQLGIKTYCTLTPNVTKKFAKKKKK